MAALTKNLADELGPHGINVVCVHPGLTRTEKTPGVIAAQAKAQGVPRPRSRSDGRRATLARSSSRRGNRLRSHVPGLAEAVAINGDVIAAGGGAPGAIHY